MVKNSVNAGDADLIPGSEDRLEGGRKATTPVFLPGKSLGQRSLAGCSPWVHNLVTKQ